MGPARRRQSLSASFAIALRAAVCTRLPRSSTLRARHLRRQPATVIRALPALMRLAQMPQPPPHQHPPPRRDPRSPPLQRHAGNRDRPRRARDVPTPPQGRSVSPYHRLATWRNRTHHARRRESGFVIVATRHPDQRPVWIDPRDVIPERRDPKEHRDNSNRRDNPPPSCPRKHLVPALSLINLTRTHTPRSPSPFQPSSTVTGDPQRTCIILPAFQARGNHP